MFWFWVSRPRLIGLRENRTHAEQPWHGFAVGWAEVEMMIFSTSVVSLRQAPLAFSLNETEKFKLGHL
jgi:hypothetical protein